MRTLTIKIEIDKETFCPQAFLYLDKKKTEVWYTIEAIQDGLAFHGSAFFKSFKIMLINELDTRYKLSDEEILHYDLNFKEIISNA